MVKSSVTRGSNKCKAGEAAQKEVLAVVGNSSSGVHSPRLNFLSGSGITLSVARPNEPEVDGSNPECESSTLPPEGDLSFTIKIAKNSAESVDKLFESL